MSVVVGAVLVLALAVSLLALRRRRRRAPVESSGERFRSLFDEAPVAYHEIDRHGVVRRVNRAECELLGFGREEILGRLVWELVAPEEREASRRAVERKLEGEEKLAPFLREYVHNGGERVAVEIHETFIRDARGGIAGLRSALLDVTARQRAEQAHERANALLEAIIQASPVAIDVLDLQGNVRRWNPGAERIFGWKAEEVLGRPAPHIPPERLKEFRRRIVETANSGPLEAREVRLLRKDGALVDVALWTAPLKDCGDGHPGVLGILGDVTGRKRDEERLRESEQRYRELFENAHDLIYLINLEGDILSLNRATEQATGYTRAEALKMSAFELLAPGDVERTREMIALKLAGGGGATIELTIVTKDGREVLMEASHRLLFEKGVPVAMVGIGRDITERKRWEAQLASYAHELQRKNEELSNALMAAREAAEVKSRFLANMSHEIRTPMNGVLGMAQLLLASPLGPEQRGHVEAVRSSAEALLAVLNDILDFSKLEAGKLELVAKPFELAMVLNEVSGLLGISAQEKGLSLSITIADAVPRRVLGDACRLRQILTCLVGNAIKFTERGEVTVTVALEKETETAAVIRAEVRDTGIGIAPSEQAKLFESFMQGDSSTTRRHGGTGLGLTLAKGLVEKMSGSIGFDSEPGKGSTFWFTAELGKPPAGWSPDPPLKLVDETCETNLNAHVLLAEDNEVNRRIALQMLARSGIRADTVSNGRDAVEALARKTYDLVLMDVHMPEMDGLAATAEIRRREDSNQHTPIVAMTARAVSGDREECLAAGMDDYITKPIRMEELRRAVARWTRRPPLAA